MLRSVVSMTCRLHNNVGINGIGDDLLFFTPRSVGSKLDFYEWRGGGLHVALLCSRTFSTYGAPTRTCRLTGARR